MYHEIAKKQLLLLKGVRQQIVTDLAKIKKE
jgi:hypothetical protein